MVIGPDAGPLPQPVRPRQPVPASGAGRYYARRHGALQLSPSVPPVRFLCLGEVVIDFTSTGALAFQGHPGGSPLNVAVAIARLGGDVGFAGQLSTDLFGEAVMDHLTLSEVDTSFLERSSAPSTLAFVAERDGDAHFTFMASGAADTLYDPRPRPSFPRELAFLEFGSISLLHEPTASTIAELVALHRDRATVVFDPNVRPDLIPDLPRYLRQLAEWLSLADVVKISEQDLRALHVPDAEEWAEARIRSGQRSVIVTGGAQGARWFRGGHPPVAVPAPVVEVVDTVGSGDAFTGAVMVSLAERSAGDGSSLSDGDARAVLAMGTAAAALNCMRSGADPPNRVELDEFLARDR